MIDSREKMMHDLQAVGFALVDINLYLDTHPTDLDALAYYRKFRNLYAQIVTEYTKLYGPITAQYVESENCWTWVDSPWPWERQA